MNIIPVCILCISMFTGEYERASTMIIDNVGECTGWIWDDEPGKLNPCIDIPLNAKTIWIELEKDIDNEHQNADRTVEHIQPRIEH